MRFGDEEKMKESGNLCEISRFYLLVGVAGIKSGLEAYDLLTVA